MQDLSNYTTDYFKREVAETWFWRSGLLRPDQLAAICYTFGYPFWGNDEWSPRDPGLVLSIGCGRGELERALEGLGASVVGYDPSPGPAEMYEGTHFTDVLPDVAQFDTVIMCESIEHIPIEQIWEIRKAVQGRLIIVNWPDYHPLGLTPEGWDHITEITDPLYDRLSDYANVILRRGSHLVLETKGESQCLK